MNQKKIKNWMLGQLLAGEFIDECLEVDCTTLAEAAAMEFDLYVGADYDIPEAVFDLAFEAATLYEEKYS